MKKDFKPHLMCPKNGKAKMARTYKEHLKYKKMGWGHDCTPKKQMGGTTKSQSDIPSFRIPIISSQRSMVLASLGIEDLIGA